MGFSQQANLFQGPFQNPVNVSDLIAASSLVSLTYQGFIPATVNLTGVGLGLVTFSLFDPLFLMSTIRSATHDCSLPWFSPTVNNRTLKPTLLWFRIPSSFDFLELVSSHF